MKNPNKPTHFGVGFIGEGNYKTSVKGKPTETFKCWIAMLRRCYCEKYHKTHPSYIDCFVCKDWHNFQNFARWYERYYPNKRGKWELDKDSIVEDNNMYSPITCCFLRAKDNAKLRKFGRKRYYILTDINGTEYKVFNQSEFAREQNLSISQLHKLVNRKIQKYEGWKLKEVVELC